MKTNKAFGYLSLLATFLLVCVNNTAFSDEISITGFTDGTDPCTTTVDTVSCPSLRSAIIYANNNTGADTITLEAGEYILSIAGVDETWVGSGTPQDPYLPSITPYASKGDLDITDSITIDGAIDTNNMLLTTIRWDSQSVTDPTVGDRIFHVQALTDGAQVSVVFSHLILKNGSVGVVPNTNPTVSNPYDIEVVNNTAGSVVIRQFRRMGGAVAVGSGASVVLYQETLHGPDADPEDGSPLGPFPGGPGDPDIAGVIKAVTFSRVVVTDNSSGADGGGIYLAVPATIEQSVISGNSSGTNGGGIYTEAAITMSETTVGSEGSVPFLADAALTATGNTAVNGGGIFDTGLHTTTISKSAINGNSAKYGGAIAGRAQVELNINNTTISGNTATIGAGITSNGASTITNSTISYNDNSTNSGGAGVNTFGLGIFTLGNTILSINTWPNGEFANCDCGHGNTDCPQIISRGYNLESCQSCAFSGTDRLDTYPLLKPLANNGGLTETHALPHTAAGDAVDSPAVDTGDPDNCPGSDQRSAVRPSDGNSDSISNCDVGAFELTIATADLQFSSISSSSGNLGLNEPLTVSAVIVNPASATNAAQNVAVAATLPSGFNNVSATLKQNTTTNPCTVDTNTVTCPVIADMNPGQQLMLNIDATTAVEGTHRFDVSVSSTADPATDNNSASISVTVLGSSDLALVSNADSTEVNTGSNLTITLTATNNGPSDANGLHIAATVPAGLELVSLTPSSGSCNNVNGDLSCNIDALAASASASEEVVLKAVQPGMFDFKGQINAKQNDGDTANNSATVTVTVTGADVGKPASSVSSDGGGSGFILALLASLYCLVRRLRYLSRQ